MVWKIAAPRCPARMRENSAAIFGKKHGDPNGIRTRVTAVKGRCPNRWTIGSSEVGGEYGGMLRFVQALFQPIFGFPLGLLFQCFDHKNGYSEQSIGGG